MLKITAEESVFDTGHVIMLVDMKNFIDTGLTDSDSVNLFWCEDRFLDVRANQSPECKRSSSHHFSFRCIFYSEGILFYKSEFLSFFTEQNKKKPCSSLFDAFFLQSSQQEATCLTPRPHNQLHCAPCHCTAGEHYVATASITYRW